MKNPWEQKLLLLPWSKIGAGEEGGGCIFTET